MSASPAPAVRAESMLREAGLRVTQPRLAVITALTGLPHASADAVFERVREQLPSTSIQAVYNVLGSLSDRGLVRKIEPAGHPGLYELRVGDNHHHSVCTQCGSVTDIECVIGHAPCLTPAGNSDFSVAQAEVTFWGVCGACQQSPSHQQPIPA